jgi:murein DD-endopeptidase MepM/ murein hydrolase activator NlpD
MSETFTVTAGSFPRYNIVVPASREGLLEPDLVETERERVTEVFSGVTSEKQWEGAFDLPLTGEFRNNAPFGQRRSYNGGPFSSYHSGHDFGVDKGEPVVAPAAGTVVMAEPLKVRGKVVILDHGLGVFSGFWHLSQIDATVGQQVGRGDVVGLVGNTGRSTGPHLHWEMRVRGVPVDPLQWTRRAFP